MSDPYLNCQFIYLDSHNRLSGSHSDFTIEVPYQFDQAVDSVVCVRATIKKSYWLVQVNQNTFVLNENGTPITITVPPGNYSANSFRYVLQNLLNAATLNTWVYTVTLPNPATQASTGQFTFTCVGGNPSFIFTDYLYDLFGFEPNTTNTFVSNTLTSVNVVNFQTYDLLRIHTDMIGTQKNNILQEVSTLSPDFTALTYECFDYHANSKPFHSGNRVYKFKILDEDYRPATLNLNILITLMVYKKNTIADRANLMSIEYMKYQLSLQK